MGRIVFHGDLGGRWEENATSLGKTGVPFHCSIGLVDCFLESKVVMVHVAARSPPRSLFNSPPLSSPPLTANARPPTPSPPMKLLHTHTSASLISIPLLEAP